MAELFTYPNMMDIPEFNLKLQKDMCYTLLFKRQIQITYDDESICICYNSHKTKVTIILENFILLSHQMSCRRNPIY